MTDKNFDSTISELPSTSNFVFEDEELQEDSVISRMEITASDGES